MQCNTFRYLLKPDKTRLARFKSGCHLHVGASCISLAPTFFKSQSALIPLLLLSDRDSLRWIRGRFLTGGETKLSRMKPPDTSEQSRFAPTFFYSCGTKNVIRPLPCSSFPNRTRCAGLRFGLRNENIRIGAPFQLRNFLFNTNPRLRRGLLVGQEVSSLSAVTRCAGLTAERWDDGGESVISLAASFYLSDMVV